MNDTAASSKRLDFTQQTTKLWILNDLPLLATPGAQPEPEPEPEAAHSVHIRRVPMLWLRHGVLKRNAASVLTLDDGDGGVREAHVREVRCHPDHAAPRCPLPRSAFCRRDVRGRCAAGQGEFLETEVVKLGAFVASADDFHSQPVVVNAASDLMVAAFGDAGRHARFAVGSNTLPLNCLVEIDGVFEIA